MLFKTLASAFLLLSSVSYLIAVGGAPADSNSTTTSPTNTSSSPKSSATGSNLTSTNGTSSSNETSSSGAQFVIYSDIYIGGAVPDPSKVEGYTVYALSFLLASGAADQAQSWASLDEKTRKSIKSKYNAAGIKLIVSAFDETETPTTSGTDATKVANDMAKWVKQYGLDGIDVDYEDFKAMDAGNGKAEEWLTTFTKTLRSQLPQGQYILTHAPVAPWFSPEGTKGGAYLTVHKNVGDMIDWYNVQFYNQEDYTNCNTLLTKSKTASKASVFEISASGVDLNKIVIGKPAIASDATDGVMDTRTLAGCLSQAKQKGWNAGAMVWEYPHADSKWIKTARGNAFPMSK